MDPEEGINRNDGRIVVFQGSNQLMYAYPIPLCDLPYKLKIIIEHFFLLSCMFFFLQTIKRAASKKRKKQNNETEKGRENKKQTEYIN